MILKRFFLSIKTIADDPDFVEFFTVELYIRGYLGTYSIFFGSQIMKNNSNINFNTNERILG